jgi:phospho-N-acetylmuramoyl-pentapeptide-transferase
VTQALLTGALAAIAAALLGGPVIRLLRSQGFAKAISEDGPESHLSKAGTPTAGGVLIFGVALVAALVAAVPEDRDTVLPIAITAALAVIGFYDDMGTLVNRVQREAHDRVTMLLKVAAFAAIGAVAAWVLYDGIDAPRLLVPGGESYDIGLLYLPVVVLVIVATTSAVGVSDGLDMLAGSLGAVAHAAFGAIALMQGQDGVAIYAFCVVGALVGFLWWNAYPARLFMGEVGALPLGASLALVALMTGWWVLLPVVGVVFVGQMGSNLIQIYVFRTQGGRRFFRMAPIHHHFEKLGWHEVSVTARFVVVGVVGALVGVGLAAWGL